jgi:hypothetical protein
MMAITKRNYDGTEEIISRIVTNRSMCLDEAIGLVGGRTDNEAADENVEIDGQMYYYDDLEYKEVDEEED